MNDARVRAFAWIGLALLCSCAGAAAPPSKIAPLPGDEPESPKQSLVGGRAHERDVEMKLPVRSAMLEDLRAIGIDPSHLPPIERLEPNQLRHVMKTFTKALGLRCNDCHVVSDFAAATPRKIVAARMWDDFSAKLTFNGGAPLYCDSCHQGRTELLNRRDPKALARWMEQSFVAPLALGDGREHGCLTCHGDPFTPKIFNAWLAASSRANGAARP